MPSSRERALALIARRQQGVFTLSQALGAGFSERQIRKRVNLGAWDDVLPSVMASTDVPLTWERKLRAACLWAHPRGVVSHRSAAALWQLDGFERDMVEISVTHGFRAPASWLIVHRLTPDRGPKRCTIERFPVTTVARTLLDLAGVVNKSRLEDGLDDALRRRLTSIARLFDVLAEDGNLRRRGAARLRALLAERSDGDPLWDSKFERALYRTLRDARIPLPARQYEVREGAGLVARVDFAYPEHKVAIEAEGFRYHSGRKAWKRDLDRLDRLARLGWRVVRVTYDDLHNDPQGVIDRILEALWSRSPDGSFLH